MKGKDRRQHIEDSISLRVITSAMAIIGVLAACQLAQTPAEVVVLSMVGIVVGSVLSYFRRRSNNFWIKIGISLGIIAVAGMFFQELVERIQASVADARIPLSNMLMALLGLHCFDLPKRRDLNLSAVVGLTLMASTATLSRSNEYAIYLMAFFLLGSYMLHLDCISRSKTMCMRSVQNTPWQSKQSLRLFIWASTLSLPVLGLLLFLVIPRVDIPFIRKLSLSVQLHLPMAGKDVSNHNLTHLLRSDGSIEVNPHAYFGFAEELDLNYRGKLSDEIVLRVNSARGEYWRTMGFDTYDGHKWSMSKPKHTVDRWASGSAILLDPVPSFPLGPGEKTIELTQNFYIETDNPNLLPVAAVPHLLYFPGQTVKIDDYGSIRSLTELERDMVYTVVSRIRQLNFGALARKPEPDERYRNMVTKHMGNYLQLPDSLPQSVRDLAARITGNKGNWFARADKLARFLRNNYEYDLEVPPTSANTDTVADFLLTRKRGYCEHFATSFVILCRTQGVPARLVTGFVPGQFNAFTGFWEVRMKDAHAWAEIFVPHTGWVSFDPTPNGAQVGLAGTERQSVIRYLLEQLEPFFQRLANEPLLKQIGSDLATLTVPAGKALSGALWWLSTGWQGTLLICTLLAAAAFAGDMLWRKGLWAKFFRSSADETQREAAAAAEASRLFFRVAAALARLGITRGETETSLELLSRARISILQLGKSIHSLESAEDLCSKLEAFMEQYLLARFSRHYNSEQLAIAGDNVEKAVDILASLMHNQAFQKSSA